MEANAVADYLKAHPEFFEECADLFIRHRFGNNMDVEQPRWIGNRSVTAVEDTDLHQLIRRYVRGERDADRLQCAATLLRTADGGYSSNCVSGGAPFAISYPSPFASGRRLRRKKSRPRQFPSEPCNPSPTRAAPIGDIRRLRENRAIKAQ